MGKKKEFRVSIDAFYVMDLLAKDQEDALEQARDKWGDMIDPIVAANPDSELAEIDWNYNILG